MIVAALMWIIDPSWHFCLFGLVIGFIAGRVTARKPTPIGGHKNEELEAQSEAEIAPLVGLHLRF